MAASTEPNGCAEASTRGRSRTVFAIAFICAMLTLAVVEAGQQPIVDDPIAAAPIHFGPLAVDPRLAVSELGVDTNVFNSSTSSESDFTFTLVPGMGLWLRAGRGLVTVDANLEFVYFNRFDSERSTNGFVSGRYEFGFNRVRPYVSATTLNTRQRPGYEIDLRVRHQETDVHAGADVRVASKSSVRMDLRHLDFIFAGDDVFNGRALNEELNRTLKAIELSWQQRLTPLTTWITRVAYERERFHFENLRNSDSVRLRSGFELGRFALIRGSAFLGYRRLSPADGGVIPQFSGLTAEVNVAYSAPTQTRLAAEVNRDLHYSFEALTPYFVQTGWTATLTQRLVGRWDAQVSGGRDRLAYRAVEEASTRTDFVDRVGVGLGYRLGENIRLGIDVNTLSRRSELPGNRYGGTRAGISVAYGY